MNIFLLLSSFLFVSMIRYCQCLCKHENRRNFFGPDCKLLCHCANKTEKCDEVTGNCSSGCATEWVGPGCQYQNLASGGVARHSKTQTQKPSPTHSQTEKQKPDAQRAIDEKESSCSFAVKKDTDIDPPWWRVTFQTMRYISGVEFLTLEKYLDQFRYFQVLIGKVSWQDRNNKNVNPKGIECYSHNGYQDLVSPFIAMCDTPILGNQVRIVMNATDSKLVLCDVRLYGGRNLAIGKAINTSDQQTPDGILNTGGKNCLLLSSDVQQQWWQISFSRPHLVQAVTVYSHVYVNLSNVLIQTKRQQNDSWISLASPSVSKNVMIRYFVPIEEFSAIRLSRSETSIRQAKKKRFVLCEVQIWGDCGKNYCGFDCLKPCFCKRGYKQTKEDKMAAICQHGCEPGWKGVGKSCGKQCADRYWGQKCNRTCGNCLNGTVCRKTDGHCENGCEFGWKGDLCSDECAYGKWGQKCNRTCGNCLNGSVCRNTDGQCEEGCDAGWQGDLCSENCADSSWGQKCNRTCGNCLNGTVCRKTDGQCEEGCDIGWQGDLCSENCADGYWGEKCSRSCTNCLTGTVCRKTDGHCEEGCDAGWHGSLCSMAEKDTGRELSLGVLGAITAGIIILIGVLVAALFIVRDKFKKRKNNSTNQTVSQDRQCCRVSNVAAERELDGDGHSEVIELQACQVEQQSTQEAEQSVYANVGSLTAQDDVHCISVSNLERFMKSTTPEQLFEEFKSLPCGLIHATEAATTPENRSKNRYVKVYPYDHCRVKLLTASNASNSDYINASFIKGLHRDKTYISASAPIDTSLDDFWQMIWEQEVESIVMVTNVVEGEKVKCLQYWPDVNSSRTYSRVNVETNIETEFADFTIRTFLVSIDGKFKQREVHHYHFTGWPDKYVPDGSTGLVHFLQTVRNKSSNSKSAWLVHCSAGVGRTGTFIALDILFAQGQQTGSVNVYQCVYDLRQQRVHMVQTKEQYKFIHEALFELFVLPCQPVQMYLFEEMYRNLLRNDPESNVTKLKLQYQQLEANRYRKYWLNDNIKNCQSHDDNQNSQSNDDVQNSEPNDDSKNCQQNEITDGEISAALLPGNVDFSRLSNNVFYIPSFTSQTGYITCPHPIEKTTEDFIQLILQEATSLVVSLDTYTCRRQSLPTEYLPTEGSTQIGPYRVKVTAVHETGYYILRHYVIIDGNHEFRTNFMTYKGWLLKHTIPSSVHEMLNLIQYVRKERSSAAQPILVLCSDGFTKSGLFCVLLSTIERMKAEEEVAIAQVMRKARLKNPKVITCFEQYKFCHDFAQLYLQSGETYVNLI